MYSITEILKVLSLKINIYYISMSKPSDDQLRQAIDAIFSKYDTDKSGTL